MATKKVTKKISKNIIPASQESDIKNPSGFRPFNPATILYKKLPNNMILITGFENFLTADEVKLKYGEVIANTYLLGSFTHIQKAFTEKGEPFIWICLPELTDRIFINTTCSKKQFGWMIATVKKCGSLLHEIIAAVNYGPVKRITI